MQLGYIFAKIFERRKRSRAFLNFIRNKQRPTRFDFEPHLSLKMAEQQRLAARRLIFLPFQKFSESFAVHLHGVHSHNTIISTH